MENIIFYVGYVGIAMLATMIVYGICRFVDYRFILKEEDRRLLVGEALIEHAGETMKTMSLETIVDINNRIYDMCGKEDNEP